MGNPVLQVPDGLDKWGPTVWMYYIQSLTVEHFLFVCRLVLICTFDRLIFSRTYIRMYVYKFLGRIHTYV